MSNPVSRRTFVAAAAAGSAVAAPAANGKLAILGGAPVRAQAFPSWPRIEGNDEQGLLDVLKGGKWNRMQGGATARFEKAWAERLGAKHCLAVANGTSAVLIAMAALDVGPGDEVIVPPYTFVATINAVLMRHAVPVFVDTDPETFQIDASKIEAAITPRTRALLPVHIGGAPADLDRILEIGARRGIPVVEDACQAHFGEWRKRKVSTLGTLGCFSFQASKNLNSGEGGAVMTNSDELIEVARSFHNNGRGGAPNVGFGYVRNGLNLRLTEFQGALLYSQLSRLEEQSRMRDENAAYLTRLLSEIPGIKPAKLHDGCTRNAWHLYMMRYDKNQFEGLPRARFLKALAAEGIPASGGYTPLNKEPILANTLNSRGYQAIYPAEYLKAWHEKNRFPVNDTLCEEAVWFTQTMLLGGKQDMEQIAEAIRKVRAGAASLLKT